MKNLIIVGAGDAGREILEFIKDINIISPIWSVKGFIDDADVPIEDLTHGDFKIIGTIADWVPSEDDFFVCAIAKPKTREKIVTLLESKGAKFVSIIHPSCAISSYANIGNGVILYRNAHIGSNATIGNFTFIQSPIAHDCIVGDFSTISGGSNVNGGVRISNLVFVASGCTFIPRITIGEGAFVGAGSVVISNVKSDTKVFGNPAKIMRL